jgi:hypothetical protein
MSAGELEKNFIEATIRTAGDLRTIATTMQLHELSELELPEIERITQEIARVVPAGNVPGLILNSLSRFEGRNVTQEDSEKYVGLLFKGVKVALDKALYTAFFAGPAAVLYGYQQILRLAGKDPDSAFPEGTWQFYLQFALREDTARHANETLGFQSRIEIDKLALNEADKLAAWLTAVAHTVQQLPEILTNEWRERTVLRVLADTTEANRLRNASDFANLFTRWEQERPYGRESLNETYAGHRRRKFDQFIEPHINSLRRNHRDQFEGHYRSLEQGALPAYLRQMSWLAYLEPEAYSEERIHYTIEQAQIGVIWQGRYFLVPLLSITDLTTARHTAAAILHAQPSHEAATLDTALLSTSRENQSSLRSHLTTTEQQELEHLRRAPVLINWDQQDANKPLAFIRQGKRGIGDHPLTIMRTDESMVFDQSHIFFDGAWGAAIAQVLTNEALTWAYHLAQTPAPRKGTPTQIYMPVLQTPAKLSTALKRARPNVEAAAENTTVLLKPMQSLRKLLKQRSDLARVTVNDLFILYRGMHALHYQPSQRLEEELLRLSRDKRVGAQKAYAAAMDAVHKPRGKNPAILIPIDASRQNPRERVFPTTFWNPLKEFIRIHQETMDALRRYNTADRADSRRAYGEFESKQAEYLALIAGFGELLARYKDIAIRGESPSTLSIKALAHMHPALQQLFTSIPGKFDVMNEVIKGEEVFSNIGRVASGSTLRRFITAKDDNEQKTFCWGVITDDNDTIYVSLRDFRPHVRVLYDNQYPNLAQMIVQDYLDAYANGLNQFITDLREITLANPKPTNLFRRIFE